MNLTWKGWEKEYDGDDCKVNRDNFVYSLCLPGCTWWKTTSGRGTTFSSTLKYTIRIPMHSRKNRAGAGRGAFSFAFASRWKEWKVWWCVCLWFLHNAGVRWCFVLKLSTRHTIGQSTPGYSNKEIGPSLFSATVRLFVRYI